MESPSSSDRYTAAPYVDRFVSNFVPLPLMLDNITFKIKILSKFDSNAVLVSFNARFFSFSHCFSSVLDQSNGIIISWRVWFPSVISIKS